MELVKAKSYLQFSKTKLVLGFLNFLVFAQRKITTIKGGKKYVGKRSKN